MNVGVWGIDWEPGDRAVTTSLEHPGGIGALYNLRLGRASTSSSSTPGLSGPRPRCWTPSTAPSTGGPGRGHLPRALGDGDGLPLGRIAEMAHARGAFLIADGAQAAGRSRSTWRRPARTSMPLRPRSGCSDRGHGRRRGGIGGTRSTAARVRRLVHVRVGRLRRDGGLVAGCTTLRGVELPPAIDRRDGPLDRLVEHVRRPRVVHERGTAMACDAADRLAAIDGSRS